MRIAVAGGTGWAGRQVVNALSSGGDEVVVMARQAGVDLLTGSGLAERLDGVDTVVDVTNLATQSARKATRFFETVTSNLLAAEQTAGVKHHVVLSIVGCDRVDLGYYRGKRRQEALVRDASVPWTVVRATQFHEFAAQMLATRGPLVLAPKLVSQPVALAEVAHHLAVLCRGVPLGLAPEIAGPQPHLRIDDMVVQLAKLRGDRRIKLRVGVPGKVGRQIADGALLPTGDGPRGKVTFAAWLADQAAPHQR